MICSRLDLRKALFLGLQPEQVVTLQDLPAETADFFMKAPDTYVLEFALSKKVMLVEGDAEYILIEEFFRKHSAGKTLKESDVHVIAVGGTSFKRYLDLAKHLRVKTAVVRDNDGDYQGNCVEAYAEYVSPAVGVFADSDNARCTFEICLYSDNPGVCEEVLGPGRKKLTVQDYMLRNKTDAALQLLRGSGGRLTAPQYIQEAIAWIAA